MFVAMRLESLLVTRDPDVISVLRPALEKLSIDVEICRGARSGGEILSSEKFDAVIVDCDDLQGGLDVLGCLRKSSSNKTSVTFAILNGTTTNEAFQLGANFVLQKPLNTSTADRCFTAAIGFMTRERRRYFRHPIEMTVTLKFGEDREVRATATNLSEGGMALLSRGKLPKGGLSTVTFCLPGTQTSLQPKAQIAWSDGSGRAGLRFIDVPKNSREDLDRWLTQQMQALELSQSAR
jgi:ActR/RegA family two-component response regulator